MNAKQPNFIIPRPSLAEPARTLKEMLVSEAKETLREYDGRSRRVQAAAVLLASLMVGPDARRINRILRLPPWLIDRFERNLRRNFVWVGDAIVMDREFRWDKDELDFAAELAICVDTLVATGEARRMPPFTGQRLLQGASDNGPRTGAS